MSMGKLRTRLITYGACLLGLAVLASGCGNPSPSPPNSGSSSPGGSSSGNSTTTITVGKAIDTIGFTVLDVAIAENYFQKQGINVKEVLLGGSAQTTAAMQGGSIQFAEMSSSALVLGRNKGIPLVAVDSLDYGIPLQLVVSNKWIKQHQITPSAPLSERIHGLKGAVYGYVSNTDMGYMKLLAASANLQPGTYRVEQLQSAGELAAGLSKGSIDAFMVSPPSSLQVVDQGNAQVLANGKEIPQWANSTYDLMITNSNYIKSHPDIVKKVATAMAEADNFMMDHPDQVLDIEKKHFPNIDVKVLKQSLALATFAKNGLQSQPQWDNAVQLMKGSGLVSGNVEVREGTEWTNQYIDTSKLGS